MEPEKAVAEMVAATTVEAAMATVKLVALLVTVD